MKRKSIVRQAQEALESKTRYGESKHAAKQDKTYTRYIYSHSTFKNYLQVSTQFVKWARDEYGCKTLDQAQKHVPEYLQKRIDQDLSSWTVKRDAAGLGKLYGCSACDFGVRIQDRRREDVTRSRLNKTSGKFSETRNRDLVDFCKATGLRRHELAKIRPEDVFQKDGKTFVAVIGGKGGKNRVVEALNDSPYRIARENASAGQKRVFLGVKSHADIHSYRAAYANKLYHLLARPITELSGRDQIYYCRGDLKGTCYDKAAMQIVSQQLGHERLSVIAQSYLR